jgi:hypothetical protein
MVNGTNWVEMKPLFPRRYFLNSITSTILEVKTGLRTSTMKLQDQLLSLLTSSYIHSNYNFMNVINHPSNFCSML